MKSPSSNSLAALDDGFPPSSDFAVDPNMNPFKSDSDPFFAGSSSPEVFEHGFGRRPSSDENPTDRPFLSQDAFETSSGNVQLPVYGRSPSRNMAVDRLAAGKMMVLEKAKKVNACIVSKLPSRLAEDLGRDLERTHSVSTRSTAARCSPVLIGRKEPIGGSNSAFDEDPFRLDHPSLEMPVSTNSPRNVIISEALAVTMEKPRTGRSMDRPKSPSAKVPNRRSLSRTKSNRMSISPKTKSHRAQEFPPPSGNLGVPKRSGLPTIPLPPFSASENEDGQKAVKPALKPMRTVSRTSSKVRSLSPASSPRSNRSKTSQDLQSQVKAHHLVQSHSKRVRSQSPRVPRRVIDPAISARSPTRSIRKTLDAKGISSKSFHSGVPVTPKGKKKSNSSGDEDVFAVIWQRSPDSSTGTNKENGEKIPRPASLSPITARRKVGGTGMRLRALERNSSRPHKDVGEERACRHGKKKGQDPKARIFRSDSANDDLGRCHSSSLLGKKGKPGANDRFTAVSKEADFPPLSPLRKMSARASTVTAPFPGSLPFQADVAFPRESNPTAHHAPRQSRRRSCV